MTVYHLDLHKLGTGMSGGEKCLVEVIRHLSKHGVENRLLTTDNARRTYEEQGLVTKGSFGYLDVSTRGTSWLHPFFAYMVRAWRASARFRALELQSDDVLICNSEFFVNSIPFRQLAGRNPETKIFYWYRMIAPSIWRGFQGQYTHRLHVPTPHVLYYSLDQMLYRRLMLPRGTVITHNPAYASAIRHLCPKNNVYTLSTYSGSDRQIPPQSDANKEFDIVWLGRFQELKGVYDIIDICRHLRAAGIDPLIAIVGGGSETVKRRLEKRISRHGLEDAIRFMGFLQGEDKLRVLERSRVFLMTSYFDSYPNVLIEAMSAGLPVVAYELPTYGVFEKGLRGVAVGDKVAAATAVSTLLKNEQERQTLARSAFDFAQTRDWGKVGEEILRLCTTDGNIS